MLLCCCIRDTWRICYICLNLCFSVVALCLMSLDEKWCPECNASEIAAAEFRKVRDILLHFIYVGMCIEFELHWH